MPSRPAIIIAANARYGLHDGSGERNSSRLAFGDGGVHRDADRRGAVARRVREVDRRLVARHQTAIAIRRRVRERADRRGMLEQTADVVERHVAHARVAVAGEQRLAGLPQRLVRVHARAVVTEQRLRHERRRLAGLARDVLDDVLVPEHLVRHLHERVVLHVDLGLTGRRRPRGGGLDLDADGLHRHHHLRAQIGELIGRRRPGSSRPWSAA